MAFTAAYIIGGVTLPNAYFRLDGSSISGGKDNGYTAILKVYADQATRNSDSGNDLKVAFPQVSIPYNAGQDPYPYLYDVAKANYPDAVDVI